MKLNVDTWGKEGQGQVRKGIGGIEGNVYSKGKAWNMLGVAGRVIIVQVLTVKGGTWQCRVGCTADRL